MAQGRGLGIGGVARPCWGGSRAQGYARRGCGRLPRLSCETDDILDQWSCFATVVTSVTCSHLSRPITCLPHPAGAGSAVNPRLETQQERPQFLRPMQQSLQSTHVQKASPEFWPATTQTFGRIQKVELAPPHSGS